MATKICKSWEQQVVDNTKKLAKIDEDVIMAEELKARVEELEGTVSEHTGNLSTLNQEIADTLRLPISRPITPEIVGIDTAGAQSRITVGGGLALENNVLKATSAGGSGELKGISGVWDVSNFYEGTWNTQQENRGSIQFRFYGSVFQTGSSAPVELSDVPGSFSDQITGCEIIVNGVTVYSASGGQVYTNNLVNNQVGFGSPQLLFVDDIQSNDAVDYCKSRFTKVGS